MQYPFGRDIEFKWYPFLDNDELKGIPSQAPVIYLFGPDTRPSLSQARAGTGAIATISAWTAISSGYKFTIPAITDPDATAEIQSRTYYLAINFYLKNSGDPKQCVLEAIELTRIFGQQTNINVTAPDIVGAYSEITSYVSADQIQKAITDSVNLVKAKMLAKGFQFSRIKNPEVLTQIVINRARMMLFSGQRLRGGDMWDQAYEEEKESYVTLLSGLQVDYDHDNDNQVDESEKDTDGGAFVIMER